MSAVKALLWIHPALMVLALAPALYALLSGLKRALVPGQPFFWKRHVRIGGLTLILWIWPLGFAPLTVRIVFGDFFLFSHHVHGGLIMLPLVLTGMISGIIMHVHKKRRTLLPIVHGVANGAAFLMYIYQTWTGWELILGLLVYGRPGQL